VCRDANKTQGCGIHLTARVDFSTTRVHDPAVPAWSSLVRPFVVGNRTAAGPSQACPRAAIAQKVVYGRPGTIPAISKRYLLRDRQGPFTRQTGIEQSPLYLQHISSVTVIRNTVPRSMTDL